MSTRLNLLLVASGPGRGLPEPGTELRNAVLPDSGSLVRQLPYHSGVVSAHSQYPLRLLSAVREVARPAQGLHVRKCRLT